MIPRRYIFIGFEDDDKPVDVLPGTLYADWRTGKVYIFTGGEWVEYGAPTTVTETTSDNRVTVGKSGNIIEVRDENGNMIYSSNYFSDAISAAIAYAEQNSLYVYIEEGTYQVDDNSITVIDIDGQQAYILIASNVAIKGAGKGSTILEFSPNYVAPQQAIIGIIAPVIEDLTISTGLEADWNAAGIMLAPLALGFPDLGYNFSNVRLKNVNIQGEARFTYMWSNSSTALIENCENIMPATAFYDSQVMNLTITSSSIVGGYDLGGSIGAKEITITNSTFTSKTFISAAGTISNSTFSDEYYINAYLDILNVENCNFTGIARLNYNGAGILMVKKSTFDCSSIYVYDKACLIDNYNITASDLYVRVTATYALIARNVFKDTSVDLSNVNSDAVAVLDNIFTGNVPLPSNATAIIQGNVKW